MRGGFLFSLVFHAAVTIVAYLGIPYLKPEPKITESAIFVDVVDAAEKSNPPPPKPELEPEEVKMREPPPPPQAEPPPPPPVTVSEPEPEPAPKPKPVAEPEPEAKPKPKLEPKPKPKPQLMLAGIRPPKKPKPPNAFASVLKTLTAMKKNKPMQEEKTDQKSAFEESIAAVLKSTPQKRHNPSLPVSMSETDAIRKHFQRCWNVPAGAKDAEGMVVELEIRFQQDGAVRSVQVLDSTRMRSDPFFRTSAEAAQRAVLHPKCNKLSMPEVQFPDWQAKYQKWQKMTLVFDPKDMF